MAVPDSPSIVVISSPSTSTASIMQDFTKDFQERGISQLQHVAADKVGTDECLEFTISAGIGQGKPLVEMESIIEFARFQQKPIARFQCELRR